MKKTFQTLALVAAGASLVALSGTFVHAETAKSAAPESLEKQIEYLRGTLAEALRQRDWKMLELAAQGFKASGLTGKDLELEVMRAERDAAYGGGFGAFGLHAGGQASRGQSLAWGQACQALAGDTKSLEALRAIAKVDPEITKAPDAKLFQTDAATYKVASKAFSEYQAILDERNQAIFCLAMLKEPGIMPRAIACLQTKTEKDISGVVYFGMGYGVANVLAEAALAADPKGGWSKLIELLGKDENTIALDAKLSILLCLFYLGGDAQKATRNFTVDGDLAEMVPKGGMPALVGAFMPLLKNWKPKEGGRLDPNANTLLNLVYQVPKELSDPEFLAALEEFKGKLAGDANFQYHRQMLDQAIAQRKNAQAAAPAGEKPVKPGKAPDDF